MRESSLAQAGAHATATSSCKDDLITVYYTDEEPLVATTMASEIASVTISNLRGNASGITLTLLAPPRVASRATII